MSTQITLSGEHCVEENYEHQWIIPKWLEVIRNDNLLKSHKYTIRTDGQSSGIQTTWHVEWKLIPLLETGSATKSCHVQWTLIDMQGMAGENLIAKIKTSLIRYNSDGHCDPEYQSHEQHRYFRVNDPVLINFCWISEDILKPHGDLSVKLNLTLVLPKRLDIVKSLENIYVSDMESESENEQATLNEFHANEETAQATQVDMEAPAICWYDDKVMNTWYKLKNYFK